MPKHWTYRKLVRALKDYDRRFTVDRAAGKGSHRMLVHPDVDGAGSRSYPLAWHGDDYVVGHRMVREIVDLFHLPEGLL